MTLCFFFADSKVLSDCADLNLCWAHMAISSFCLKHGMDWNGMEWNINRDKIIIYTCICYTDVPFWS